MRVGFLIQYSKHYFVLHMDIDSLPKTQSEVSIKKAKSILNRNTWEGRYTVPSGNLYPYQWNWDSGFVAMGFAHFDIPRAIKEMESLFEGQWGNGLLPHIVFHSKKREGYFPGPSYWRSNEIPGASKKVETSGITQPPVHGFILERFFHQYVDTQEVKDFVKAFYPKVMKLHRYYYENRDPNKEGLAFIFHPWASGRDNSPLWDDLVKSTPIDPKDIPAYKRYDNLKADPSERPSDRDYDVYVYLMELGRKHQYDGHAVAKESPFVIQDTLFNAILIRSNEALINLGEELGLDSGPLSDWNEQSKKSFNEKLWSEELGTYVPYDLRNEQQIRMKEIGAYTSLFAGIPSPSRSRQMRDDIEAIARHAEGFRVMPSFDPEHSIFDPKKYWKGPIWPQMNWLVYQGLKRYGYHGIAKRVKYDLLELVDKLGFHEYFDPRTEVANQLKHGYGGSDFSWTAAVYLDLISE